MNILIFDWKKLKFKRYVGRFLVIVIIIKKCKIDNILFYIC